ncbi:N amino acid transport system protein [Metarhizium anisopliae]|nr:N amino acid transport system protein [Metarhizium anisopliae]
MKFLNLKGEKEPREPVYDDQNEKEKGSTREEDASVARDAVLVDDGEQAANIFSEGGKNYRTMGRWDTALVLASNQVGLGILSLPKILDVLGIVPAVITIIGLGVVSWYTAYELLQFYRKHPHVVNMADMARVIGGVPFEVTLKIVGDPSFTDGVNAVLKVCYAYAGNVGFVSYMAEMKNPSKDFVPALTVLQVFSVVLYLITAVVIYCLSGQYTTSPALGSAPTIPAKIAYGIVLPAILSTGLVFGHTAIKYLYVVAMRAMKSTHQLTDRSVKSWGTWIVCATLFWTVSFVIANAIPIFDSILSIASATFIAWFTFGISGVFWYHRNWQEKFHRKNIPLAIVNALLIAQALFMNGVGLWAAIRQLVDIFNDKENKIGGVFPCGDNSLF